MKIAQFSPPFIAVPPQNYGGIELVVYNLTEGLVKNGHDVTLYSAGGSKTSGKEIMPFPYALDKEHMEKLFSPLSEKLFWMHSFPSLYYSMQVFEEAKNFDIIHNHFNYIGVMLSQLVRTPVVSTYHGDFTSAMASPIEKMILAKYIKHPWVAISESQKKHCTIPLNFVGVVPLGIAIETFEYGDKDKGYVAWLGRITPKKGLKEAIQVAKTLRYPLHIAGFINPRDQEYFDTEIKPLIDNDLIKMKKELNIQEKIEFYKNARLVLYPVSWEEPFGLVMIESMACGTPVIGYSRGAVPEVIVDEETGYLINPSPVDIRGNYSVKKPGLEGLVDAAERILKMPDEKYRDLRSRVRKHVEDHFTINVMVQKYEKIYEKVINDFK